MNKLASLAVGPWRPDSTIRHLLSSPELPQFLKQLAKKTSGEGSKAFKPISMKDVALGTTIAATVGAGGGAAAGYGLGRGVDMKPEDQKETIGELGALGGVLGAALKLKQINRLAPSFNSLATFMHGGDVLKHSDRRIKKVFDMYKETGDKLFRTTPLGEDIMKGRSRPITVKEVWESARNVKEPAPFPLDIFIRDFDTASATKGLRSAIAQEMRKGFVSGQGAKAVVAKHPLLEFIKRKTGMTEREILVNFHPDKLMSSTILSPADKKRVANAVRTINSSKVKDTAPSQFDYSEFQNVGEQAKKVYDTFRRKVRFV